jgi:hypothetical protein
MNMFWKAKRRLRNEIAGLKYVIGKPRSKRIITLSYVTYEISKTIYNPWYLLEIARRSIMSVI